MDKYNQFEDCVFEEYDEIFEDESWSIWNCQRWIIATLFIEIGILIGMLIIVGIDYLM